MARVISIYPHLNRKIPVRILSGIIDPTTLRKGSRPVFRTSQDPFANIPSPPFRKWLTPAQVHTHLGISFKTLQILKNKHQLPFANVDGEYYFDPLQVDAAMQRLIQFGRKSSHRPKTYIS